jgi:hypothetical protein
VRHARKHVVAYLEEAAALGSPEAISLRAALCAESNTAAVITGLSRAFGTIIERRAA